MTAPALGFLVAALVALVVVSVFEAARILRSACQWFWDRSALADRESFSPSSLPGEGVVDAPQRQQPSLYVTSQGRHLSSPPPACFAAALVAAVVLFAGFLPASAVAYWPSEPGPYTEECEDVLSGNFEGEKPNPEIEEDVLQMEQCEIEAKEVEENPPEPFDPGPDLESFGAGVEISIFTALFTIGSLLVVNWIVKTMRSSS